MECRSRFLQSTVVVLKTVDIKCYNLSVETAVDISVAQREKQPSQVHFSWLYIHSYIWRHLDIGYVQGMCDLLAPLLVILDDGKSTH